jgi:hypothetical protein
MLDVARDGRVSFCETVPDTPWPALKINMGEIVELEVVPEIIDPEVSPLASIAGRTVEDDRVPLTGSGAEPPPGITATLAA